MPHRLDRVRGTNDWSVCETGHRHRLTEALRRCCAAYGYAQIELPVLEHTDLFLLKSGEEITAKLYAFPYRGRDLCLRPEMTASVGRYFVERCQAAPLPQRFAYAGPVFRYERPQRGRYRQFTQVGVELIGPEGPAADAELIALAWHALASAGLADYRTEVGHFGVMAQLLHQLGLDERAQNFVIASMQDLGKPERGRAYVLERLAELYGQEQPDGPSAADSGDSVDRDDAVAVCSTVLGQLDAQTGRKLVLGLLRAVQANVGSTRRAEEVADRILGKLQWQNQAPVIARAIDLAERLRTIKAAPPTVFERIREVLAEYKLSDDPVCQLEETVRLLTHYQVPADKLTINLGLGRGLPYYTGMVFEMFAETLGAENQLCGGGRYDTLLRLLGAAGDVPAAGFAFGLERIKLALEAERTPVGDTANTQVLVIPLRDDDHAYAITVAERLRQADLRVELDLMDRGVKTDLRHASRRGIPFCAIVGSAERESATVTIRDMAAHHQQRVRLAEAARLCQSAPHEPDTSSADGAATTSPMEQGVRDDEVAP